MEYVPGTPIEDYLQNNPLSLRDRLTLFRKVCDAVAQANKNGVRERAGRRFMGASNGALRKPIRTILCVWGNLDV
ncbi:MAG: hypothetical protein GY711_23285 [bacterium]|nr:hypothetical protein [bacterium]